MSVLALSSAPLRTMELAAWIDYVDRALKMVGRLTDGNSQMALTVFLSVRNFLRSELAADSAMDCGRRLTVAREQQPDRFELLHVSTPVPFWQHPRVC